MHSNELPKVKFSLTRFREGYELAEVDAFLDSLRDTLIQWESGRQGVILSAEVVEQRFAVTRFRNGYDQDQVDNFLDEATTTLAGYEKGRTPGY